jgi:endonuclease/exonuclease/phosphatase family metal-dependent hydrolase
MQFDALTWNVFHGRDDPPDPGLFTKRSKFLGIEERNATHLQVTRDLFHEFTQVLAEALWDVALLQEFPPRWASPMADACGADMQVTMTSRNWLRSLRTPIARRNVDLMGSWEGGANVILARGALRSRQGAQELVLRGPPQRRIVTFARLERARKGDGCIVVANLHASGPNHLAVEDTRMAAEAAVGWAGDDPLILGGDLNVSPKDSCVYDELEHRFGLGPPTAERSIDHLLARNLEIVEAPSAWPPEAREVQAGDRAIRLSDHPPIQARFATPEPTHAAPSR